MTVERNETCLSSLKLHKTDKFHLGLGLFSCIEQNTSNIRHSSLHSFSVIPHKSTESPSQMRLDVTISLDKLSKLRKTC